MSLIKRASAIVAAFVLLVCGFGATPAATEQLSPDTAVSMYIDSDDAQTLTGLQSAASDVEKSILLVGTTWTGTVVYYDEEMADWYESEEFQALSLCTGWFASTNGDIVTAGHCVDPNEGVYALANYFLEETGLPSEYLDSVSSVDRASVQVVQPSEVEGAVITDVMNVQVVDFQAFDDGDHALLKAANVSDTPALSVATGAPETGADLTAIGFPGSVQAVSDGARIRASFKTGTVSSRQVSQNGVAGTEVNADISPGMSGGPTVDADSGVVLGVNSYIINGEEQAFNFITDTEGLATFLKNNNVEFSTDAPPQGGPTANGSVPAGPAKGRSVAAEPESDSNVWLWVLIGGVVLLAIAVGVVVVFVVRRMRRNQRYGDGSVAASIAATDSAFTSGAPQQSTLHYGAPRPGEDTVQCADGHPNRVDASFCSSCGKALALQQPPPNPGPFVGL